MCALFTEEKKVKLAPQTEASKTGEQFLSGQLGQTIRPPLAETEGLTPVQLAIQQALPGLLERIGESGELATGAFSDVLTRDADARTSPAFEGFREEAERLKTEGVTRLRQRAELGGMLGSSSAAVSEASFLSEADSAILKELGRLTESEEGRKLLAAQGIGRTGAQEIANIAAVGGVAEVQRSIEQQRADALYNQAIQSLLLPFQLQSNIATNLLNFSPDVAVTGGGISDLGFAFSAGGQAAGAAAGAAACDENIKTELKTIGSALEKLKKLDGKTYSYVGVTDRRHAGVVAQDVEGVLPEAVEMIEGIRYVRFDGMIALLVNAVKEIGAKVDSMNGTAQLG